MATNVAAAMLTLIDEYTGPVADRFVVDNPMLNTQGAAGTFDKTKGYTPNVTQLTHGAYTKRLAGVSAIGKIDGTPGFQLANRELVTGEKVRGYTPIATSRQSQLINMENVAFKVLGADSVRNMYRTLMEDVLMLNLDFTRRESVEMVNAKVILNASGGNDFYSNTNTNFYPSIAMTEGTGAAQSGSATTAVLAASTAQADDFYNGKTIVFYETAAGEAMNTYAVVTDYTGASDTITVADWLGGDDPDTGDLYCIIDDAKLPTDSFNETQMKFFHTYMDSIGAAGSYGKSEGDEVFTAIVSDVAKKREWQTQLASKIQYTDKNAGALLSASGLDQSIFGLIPVRDKHNVRYDANMLEILPFTQQATTVGYERIFNTAYLPVIDGGSAVYEEIYVQAPGIYQREHLAVENSVANATFASNSYMGEISFLATPTFGATSSNPRGKNGYFDAQWAAAPRPGRADNGVALLCLITSP